jgi:hypothetical protein
MQGRPADKSAAMRLIWDVNESMGDEFSGRVIYDAGNPTWSNMLTFGDLAEATSGAVDKSLALVGGLMEMVLHNIGERQGNKGFLPFAVSHDEEPCPNVAKGLMYGMGVVCMAVSGVVLSIDGVPVPLDMDMFDGDGGGEITTAALMAVARQLKIGGFLQTSLGWSLKGIQDVLSNREQDVKECLAKICADGQDEALAAAVGMMKRLLLDLPDLRKLPRALLHISEMIKWFAEDEIRPGNAAGALAAAVTMALQGGQYAMLLDLDLARSIERINSTSAATSLFARRLGIESMTAFLKAPRDGGMQDLPGLGLLLQLCGKAIKVEADRLHKASGHPTCPLASRSPTFIRWSAELGYAQGVISCDDGASCVCSCCSSRAIFMVRDRPFCGAHIRAGTPAVDERVVPALQAMFERMEPGDRLPLQNVVGQISAQVVNADGSPTVGALPVTSGLIVDLFLKHKHGDDLRKTGLPRFPADIKMIRCDGVSVEFKKAMPRQCTYSLCDSPPHQVRFYEIEVGKTAGGQDWSPLAGSVLCKACYERFRQRGTLERAQNKQLVGSARQCTYKHCDSPTHGSKFFQIEEGKSAGGRDWSPLVGEVLCHACYERFLTRGTLERAQNKPLVGSGPCSYSGCDSPPHSGRFYQIEEGKTAAGRDWSLLFGEVLCEKCYNRFHRSGTLQRKRHVKQKT